MKIAVISDIHSNLYALDAVLEDIKKRGIETIYCLGDLVGYHTRPDEVLEKIRTLQIPCILGNHDEKILLWGEKDHSDEEPEEKTLVTRWTFQQIKPINYEFLKQLPRTMTVEMFGKKVLLVHGSPNHISEYIRKDEEEKQEEMASHLSELDALMFGHTHDYYKKTVNDVTFINVGSVGRMKDGDTRGCYTIVSEHLETEFVRVAYDNHALVEEILASPLPDQFAEVIGTGKETK